MVCLGHKDRRRLLGINPVEIGFRFELEIRIRLGLWLGILELSSDLSKFEMTICT